MPVKAGYQKVCEIYKRTMMQLHVPIPATTTTTPTTPVVAPPTQTTTPCDDSPKSNTCYYYKLYQDRCTEGKTYKRCGTYATMIKNAGYDLPTSSGTVPTPVPTPVPTYELQNIKTIKSGDSIRVSWDAPTDFTVKYYKMYVSENGGYASYKSKLSSTDTSYTISNVQEGKSYKLKIKMYYANDRGSTSIKYFYSDVVSVPKTTPVDRTPPVITVPSDITVRNTTNVGSSVAFTVSATDDTDESVSVKCSQASGTVFTIGSTTITCDATDEAGNISIPVTFNIIVEFFRAIGVLPTPTEYYGGEPYNMVTRNATGDWLNPSTMTIGATNTTGVNGVVIAAHGLSMDPGHAFVEHRIGTPPERIGNDVVLTQQLRGNVDAVFIPITEPNIIVPNYQIRALDRTIINVTQGSLIDVPIGKVLNIYGTENNGGGILLFSNATIYELKLFVNMGIALYPSQGGDSGAPIVYHNNGESHLVGVHHGGSCYIDPETDAYPNPIDVLNNTALCTKDNYYYKAFSAWENVKNQLSLR